MNLSFRNKAITGILGILPANEVKFEDEMHNYNFSEAKSMKLKLAMGFNKKRVVEGSTCISDLCLYGMNYLFDNDLLHRNDIDALILVTQSPDYLMPPTSSVLHGSLGLKKDIFCLDINQGCAGYIIGLIQAFIMLDQESIRKVVLINADVLSRKVSKRDRNSNPLVGDAATISIIERSKGNIDILGSLKMDGSGYDALMIPAGGFKEPSDHSTSELYEDPAGNFRSLDNLVMKGDEVFNFVLNEIPPMIESVLIDAGLKKEEIDFFMFHQPNRFMLNKLADKIGIPREKMPSNIVEEFGNPSGASIPLAIAHNLGESALNTEYRLCLSGFGVGLTWGALLMKTEKMKFNRLIDYKN